MKKIMLILVPFIFAMLLSGCYKSRVELFTIPLESSTYIYSDTDGIYFLEKHITFLEIYFEDTNQTTDVKSDYEANLFGDFTNQEIKLFTIQFVIGFDDEIYNCDVIFMGIANPQRHNAYRLLVTIPELIDQEDTFNVILDFNNNLENKDGLQVINVQIIDFVNPPNARIDAYFDLMKQSID